jgi:hypothetical protein
LYLIKTGQGNTIQGQLSPTVLNSQVVQSSFTANKSYFLSQAFPELGDIVVQRLAMIFVEINYSKLLANNLPKPNCRGVADS